MSNQIDNGTLFFFASHSELLARNCLLGFWLLRSIDTSTECRRSTAAVVPSYLVRRLGVPVVEFVLWRIDFDTQHSLDLRDLVTWLYDRSLRSCLSVDEHSLLSCWVYLTRLYGAPVQSITGSNCVIFFCCCCLSLLSIVSNATNR